MTHIQNYEVKETSGSVQSRVHSVDDGEINSVLVNTFHLITDVWDFNQVKPSRYFDIKGKKKLEETIQKCIKCL